MKLRSRAARPAALLCGLAFGIVAATASSQERAVRPSPARASAVPFLVVANRESPLSAVAGGRIASIKVQLGDRVRAGQVMATLECSDVEAKEAAARAEYSAAQLKYEAKATLQGLQSAAELEVELAAAEVDRARSQIRIFASQLEQCRFVAPFDGYVAHVHVKVGQGVAPGTPVIDLVGSGTPEARFNVPSDWVGWLAKGRILAAVVDETGGGYALKVTRISASVDAVSQTIAVQATFVGDPDGVLPGMSGRAWRPSPRTAR